MLRRPLAFERPDCGLPAAPAHKRVWVDQPGAVARAHRPEILPASEAARWARRAALPGAPGAEHREPSRTEGFERRLEAAADEDPKEPVLVAASLLESGVAARESGDPGPPVKATAKRRETKARSKETKLRPTVEGRSSALEQPSVAQAEPWEQGAALQPADESAPCQ